MATSMARSGLRAAAVTAFRGGAKSGSRPIIPNKEERLPSRYSQQAELLRLRLRPPRRPYETAKWEKITYAGIVTCAILSVYNLSKGHSGLRKSPHPEQGIPPGPDGLFEKQHHSEHQDIYLSSRISGG